MYKKQWLWYKRKVIMQQHVSSRKKVKHLNVSDLEVVMEHLFAVEQIRAGLAQITQVYL